VPFTALESRWDPGGADLHPKESTCCKDTTPMAAEDYSVVHVLAGQSVDTLPAYSTPLLWFEIEVCPKTSRVEGMASVGGTNDRSTP
jgi:hypothetical protein